MSFGRGKFNTDIHREVGELCQKIGVLHSQRMDDEEAWILSKPLESSWPCHTLIYNIGSLVLIDSIFLLLPIFLVYFWFIPGGAWGTTYSARIKPGTFICKALQSFY